jgi:hypothetical protein
MAKIVLADTLSGYNLARINENFEKVQNALNNEVLYRDNPEGEANQMQDLLDMNGKRIINLPSPQSPNDAARLSDIPFETIPIGETSALLVSFTPTPDISSINAQAAIEEVSTEVRNEIATVTTEVRSLVVTPEQYGCVGDGVTNDATPFAAAVAAANTRGRKLVLKKGANYRFLSTVTLPNVLVIEGYGAKINTGTSHIAAFNITSSHVKIFGVEFEGAGNSAFNTNGKVITVNGVDNGAGVAPTYIKNIKIQDCQFLEAGRSAIQANFVDKITVVHNTFDDIAYAGAEFLSCNNVKFHDNYVKNITPGTSGNMYGVYVSRQNTADLVRYPICNNAEVTNNGFENIEWEAVDCHGVNGFKVLDNTFLNTGDVNAAIAIIHADNEVSTPIAAAVNVLVKGNIVSGSQQYGFATSTTISTVLHTNIVVTENIFFNCGSSVTTNDVGGARFGSVVNGVCSNNVFDYCGPYGVVVNNQYAANINITDNVFNRIVSNVETTPAPILIDRGASGNGAIYIEGNSLRRASLGETYESVFGVRVVSTDGGNIRIGENHFDAATTKYSLTLAQAAGKSKPVHNFGEDLIAVTTSVSSASKVITLSNSHSSNTLFVPSAIIWRATGNERTIINATRTSTTSITITVYTNDGANFDANGNIEFYWETEGY